MPAEELHEAGPQESVRSAEAMLEQGETETAVMEALAQDADAMRAEIADQKARIDFLESLLRERVDNQPRRVRTNEGVTERLVKYELGGRVTWEWEPVEGKAEYKAPAETTTSQDAIEGWKQLDTERAAVGADDASVKTEQASERKGKEKSDLGAAAATARTEAQEAGAESEQSENTSANTNESDAEGSPADTVTEQTSEGEDQGASADTTGGSEQEASDTAEASDGGDEDEAAGGSQEANETGDSTESEDEVESEGSEGAGTEDENEDPEADEHESEDAGEEGNESDGEEEGAEESEETEAGPIIDPRFDMFGDGRVTLWNYNVEMAPEHIKELDAAREEYAERTARARNGHRGRFLKDSNFLINIPGLKKVADWVNEKFPDTKLDTAREKYESLISRQQEAIMDSLYGSFGDTDEVHQEVLERINELAIDHDLKLEAGIVAARAADSGKVSAFAEFWEKHDSLGWKVGKFAAIAGAGTIAATLAAVVAGPVAGIGVAAGATAAGMGLTGRFNKKRANVVLGENAEGDAVTVAEAQSAADKRAKAAYVGRMQNAGNIVDTSYLNSITEARTDEEVNQNRNRVYRNGAAALAGGAVGAALGSAINEGLQSRPDSDSETPVVADRLEDQGEASQPEAPVIVGNEFPVEPGSSYTNELMQFADMNGHSLDKDQAKALYDDAVKQFGPDFIDVNGPGNDIYQEGDEFRLVESGSGKWVPGLTEFAQKWMADRGLW